VPIRSLSESPFFLDTGANAHISPERSDFKALRPIPPHPISGVGGTYIYVVGVGTIEIHIAGGHKLTLDNVLYAPASTVRLISVLTLNRSGRYTSHFDDNSFWLTNSGGATILHGNVHEGRKLYNLSLSNVKSIHKWNEPTAADGPSPNAMPSGAFHANRTPNVETWHHCLGHCNVGAIVDMARKEGVEGMMIDLSCSPAKCDACIHSKQTHSSVPKSREGEKATRPLERVFVDLCGPICPVSSSGHVY